MADLDDDTGLGPWRVVHGRMGETAEELRARVAELERERDEARDERDVFKRTLDKRDAEVGRLRALVECLLDNDFDDYAADGITVLDVWRKDARAALRGMAVPGH